jgi:hypothetical protein
MHPILDRFLDKWVWPTMPGAPGADFRQGPMFEYDSRAARPIALRQEI